MSGSQAHRRHNVRHAFAAGVVALAITVSGCVMVRPAMTRALTLPTGLAVHPVSYPSPSGSTIKGWWLAGTPGTGAVLLLHGVGDNRTSMVSRARFLHEAGYTVLLPDFQAHGESAGNYITFGALESLDAEAALVYLRSCAPGERVGLIGISMGGAAALLGPGPVRVDAFVLESVYPTIRQAVEDRFSVWLGPLSRLNRVVAQLVMRSVSFETGVKEGALQPIERVALAGAPLLMMAGTRDRYTPLVEAQELFARASEPKEFWAVEGAGHEDLHAFAGDEYEQRVTSFFARHLHSAVSDAPVRRAASDTTETCRAIADSLAKAEGASWTCLLDVRPPCPDTAPPSLPLHLP